MRLKLAALLTLAVLALAGFSLVLYNFAANGWQLEDDPFTLHRIFGEQTEGPPDVPVRTREWEFELSDSIDLLVEAANASVVIEGYQGTRAYVMALLEGDAANPEYYAITPVRRSANALHVAGSWLMTPQEAPHAHVEIRLYVPRHLNARIAIADGSIRLTSFDGALHATAGAGTITALDVTGRVDISLESGTVKLRENRLSGRISVGSGTINSNFNEGDLELSAGEGITSLLHFGALEAASNGDITARIYSRLPSGRLYSRAGVVDLALLPGARCDLEVDAPPGRIDMGVALDSTVVATNAGQVAGPLNGGGAKMVVRSDHGSVRVGIIGKDEG